MWAVMAGTFTLRFSTGLTGAMLGVYLAKLPEHGGVEVAATTLGLLHATFYLSELVLSPVFGVMSDRLGHQDERATKRDRHERRDGDARQTMAPYQYDAECDVGDRSREIR